MCHLSECVEAKTAMDDVIVNGSFKRTEATCRSWIKADGSTPYKPEPNRYHIYVSYACPWVCFSSRFCCRSGFCMRIHMGHWPVYAIATLRPKSCRV